MLDLMSLEKVKDILGIVDGSGDARLETFIPIVSADVREILNDPMDKSYNCLIKGRALETWPNLPLGQVVVSEGLPPDTYITAKDNGEYTLSAEGVGDRITPTINIRQWQAIARMVFYRSSLPAKASDKVQSKSMGPVSVSFSLNINKRWNYPQELIDDLGYPRLRSC